MKRTLILASVLLFALSATATANIAVLNATDLTGGQGYTDLGVGYNSGMGMDYKTAPPAPPLGDYVSMVIDEEGSDWANYILDGSAQTCFDLKLQTMGTSIPQVQVNLFDGVGIFGQAWGGNAVLYVTNDPTATYGAGQALWSGSLAGKTKAAPVTVVLNGNWTAAPLEMQFGTPDCIPEPGSMLAMFTGLVGLVGFGIRRRK